MSTSTADAPGCVSAAHGRRAAAAGRIVAAAVSLATVVAPGKVAAQRQEPLPRQLEGVGVVEHLGARVPFDLAFTDENGKPVRLGEYFSRRPVLLTLNYYECPMLCTLQLNGLVEGLRQLSWLPGQDFEIVTVSINPLETSTLARLKKQSYIAELGKPGAAQGWHFLVGGEAEIRALAEAVGFGYRYDEERKEYAHAAALMVATPDGRLARYLYGVEYEPKSLRLALLEAGEGKVGTTVEQALLFCFHYDAAEGRYVVAAQNLMRLGGIVTVSMVGLWLAGAWVRSYRHHQHARSGAPSRTGVSS